MSNELFDRTAAPLAGQRRLMFGYPCYFINGNMFAGLHQDNVIVRLSPQDRAAILAAYDEETLRGPLPNCKMREYVALPPSLYGQEEELAAWLGRALAYASSLPPKAPKKKSRKKN